MSGTPASMAVRNAGYAKRVFDYDWVRIFVSSGLKSYGLTERYLDIIRSKKIEPAA
jgi:hypothetical protein